MFSAVSRKLQIVLQGVVLLALVAGTVGFVSLNKPVTLTVDGKSDEFRTFGRTVGDVLKAQDVALGTHDAVSPAVGEAVDRNEEIVVDHARRLELTIDGEKKTVWTTARTVGEALDSSGLRLQGADLSASRSDPIGRQGLDIDVTTPKKVELKADGKTRSLTTTARTVSDVLHEAGVEVGKDDELSVDEGTAVEDGLTVTLTRIDFDKVTKTVSVDHASKTVKDPKKYVGEKSVETKGKDGKKKIVYKVKVVDGKKGKKTKVSEKVVTKPVTEVISVGSKKKPASRSSDSGSGSGSSSSGSTSSKTGTKADALNWAALAKCESGGNPKAVNPNGHYGLYQFSLSTWRAVGGSGNPTDASAAEQTRRAKMLYNRAGAGQWSCGSHLFD